jgi:hypothetical protein
VKADRLALLPHRHRREKNRNDAILAKRHTVVRVAGNLENKLAISTLIQELIRRQTSDNRLR